MRSLWILLLLGTLLSGLKLDVEELEKELATHPDDTRIMLLLAKDYARKKELKKAKEYTQKILALEPQNEQAQQLLSRIEALERGAELAERHGSIKEGIAALYAKKEYGRLLELLPALEIEGLGDEERLMLAEAALKSGRHRLAKELLKGFKNGDDPRYLGIMGLACYHLGDFGCARRDLERLLSTPRKALAAEPLLEIYAKEGERERFKELLQWLKQHNPAHPKIARYEKILKELERRLDATERQLFMQNPTYKTLERLVFRYYRDDPYTILDLFRRYFERHPHDQRALSLFGRVVTWRGDINIPDDLLSRVARSKNYEAKLLVGKALSWQGQYRRALPFLLEVLQKGNAKERYEAKKAIAFIYKWQNRDEQARKLFEELYAQNPQDMEVREALDLLKGDVERWIEHYEAALRREPNNSDYLLRLAQYYRLTGDIGRSIAAYERYLKLRPDDLATHRYLGELYLAKGELRKGFGHLEYYAHAAEDPEALLELAKRYAAHGFYKEALSVTEELLKEKPDDSEAKKLRAELLQASPRYLHTPAAAPRSQKEEKSVERFFRSKAAKILADADRLYFSGHYEGSLGYFRDYLRLEPEDKSARERYAYALEYTRRHKEAAAEFFLLLSKRDDPIWRYHYAFNLARSGKTEKAREILENLRSSLPKPLPPFLRSFLREWEDAWEHLDFERYAKMYDPKAFDSRWRRKKERLFRTNGFVEVVIKDPVLIEQRGDIYVVRFYQIYRSKIKKDSGYKTLTIRCKEGECKILKEEWRPATYNRLKDLKELPELVERLLEELTLPAPKKEISLPGGIKKHLLPQKEVLNVASFSPPKKKLYLPARYSRGDPWRVASRLFDIGALVFDDSAGVSMREGSLLYGGRIRGSYWLTGRVRAFGVSDAKGKESGREYGIGFATRGVSALFLADSTGSRERFGYELRLERDPFGLGLWRQNAVYTKRTSCSADLMQNGLFLSLNTTLFGRSLWMRGDLAKLEGDIEKTLMFDYTVIEKKPLNSRLKAGLEGWYQFHSKTSDCYYSPAKTDATLLGLRWELPLGRGFLLRSRAGGGYSFWEEAFLYDLGLFLSRPEAPYGGFDLGCRFSNSSPTAQNEDYQALECTLGFRKFL